jgi:23S rRNA (guanine2445-N2)-methyltransferase / 23S rRNA (guanine2069-N7)-methyltransferase
MPQFFATCASSLEYLLVDELKELGASNVKEGLSMVNFEADWPIVYDILMWTRVASRVLYPIARFEAKDEQTLYDQVSIIDWSQHIASNASFVVNAQTFRSELTHSKFISQRIKDAIVDHFTDMGEQRPDVEFDRPDVSIQCRIRQNQVILSIDLAGVGLHHRGYRLQGGAAPIKENLASALLIRAGWLRLCNDSSVPELSLYDPMCGSGTFLIEAAMMALDIAPGIYRDYLGIFGWSQFNPELWQKTIIAAQQKREKSTNRHRLQIIGSDMNPKAVNSAQSNLALAKLEDVVKIHIAAIDQVEQFNVNQIGKPSEGLVIVNPPYSERLGEFDQVKQLYAELGNLLKQNFDGWKASVLSPDKSFGHSLGIRAKKIYKFNNASIPCELLNFELKPENYLNRQQSDRVDKNFKEKLTEHAIQLCNRIEKNGTKLKKYLNKNNISCYRIYDADLPEYNAAIDVYENQLHIQEYKAPKSVDQKLALRRIKEIERVAAGVFQLPLTSVFVKQRRQQKGDWQYGTNNSATDGQSQDIKYQTITENGRKFLVNMADYLDTGLFLDHRKTRQLIGEICQQKTLLNLFCYTASASVYAVTAGAESTTNVDMSNTYLKWAKDNFKQNNINLDKHHFVRRDIIEWLEEAIYLPDRYDVIFLDPPTFSNSKKMTEHFDIQRDHCGLIEKCTALLAQKGVLIFSNNFRQFDMQFLASEEYLVKEITKQTTSQDFSRKNLHRCWRIEAK